MKQAVRPRLGFSAKAALFNRKLSPRFDLLIAGLHLLARLGDKDRDLSQQIVRVALDLGDVELVAAAHGGDLTGGKHRLQRGQIIVAPIFRRLAERCPGILAGKDERKRACHGLAAAALRGNVELDEIVRCCSRLREEHAQSQR